MTAFLILLAVVVVAVVWTVAVNLGYSHGYKDAVQHRADYDEAIFLEQFGDDIEAAREGRN